MTETLISVSLPDGRMTPPAPLSVVRKAVEEVQSGHRRADGRDSSAEQIEAFDDNETGRATAHGVARDQLRAFVERIERLEEEKKTLTDDIKDVYGEAKCMGFDTKILKKVIALRKKDDQERIEEDLVLDTYLHALGMIEQGQEA